MAYNRCNRWTFYCCVSSIESTSNVQQNTSCQGHHINRINHCGHLLSILLQVEKVGKVISQCNAAEGFDQLFTVWHFVDAFIYSFLHFIILSVLNVLIIHKVLLAKRNCNVLPGRVTQNNRTGQSPFHRHSKSSVRLTVMLLTVSFAFVITTLPMSINLNLNFYWSSLADKLSDSEQIELFTKATLVVWIAELLEKACCELWLCIIPCMSLVSHTHGWHHKHDL